MQWIILVIMSLISGFNPNFDYLTGSLGKSANKYFLGYLFRSVIAGILIFIISFWLPLQDGSFDAKVLLVCILLLFNVLISGIVRSRERGNITVTYFLIFVVIFLAGGVAVTNLISAYEEDHAEISTIEGNVIKIGSPTVAGRTLYIIVLDTAKDLKFVVEASLENDAWEVEKGDEVRLTYKLTSDASNPEKPAENQSEVVSVEILNDK